MYGGFERHWETSFLRSTWDTRHHELKDHAGTGHAAWKKTAAL